MRKDLLSVNEIISTKYFGNKYSLKFLPNRYIKRQMKQKIIENKSLNEETRNKIREKTLKMFPSSKTIRKQDPNLNFDQNSQSESKTKFKSNTTSQLGNIQQKFLDYIEHRITKEELLKDLTLKDGIYYDKNNLPVLSEQTINPNSVQLQDENSEKKIDLQVQQSIQFYFNELYQQVDKIILSSFDSQEDITQEQEQEIKEIIQQKVIQIQQIKFPQNNSKNELIYLTNMIFITLYQMNQLNSLIIFDKDQFKELKNIIKVNVQNVYYALFKKQFDIDGEIEKFVKYLSNITFSDLNQDMDQNDFIEQQQNDVDNQQYNDEKLFNQD